MRGGTFTLALTLISLGGGLLASNLGYASLSEVLAWWPLVLIVLGIEIVVRHGRAGTHGRPTVWDRLALVLVLLLCLGLAGAHWALSEWERGGPWGLSWAREFGWLPWAATERTLEASLEADAGLKAVEVVAGVGTSVDVAGGAQGVRAHLAVTQPGRTEEESRRLAGEWALDLKREGDTAILRVKRPEFVPGRGRGNGQLALSVPSGVEVRVGAEHAEVRLRSVSGCRISGRFGRVSVEDVPGAVDVKNEHGPIALAACGSAGSGVNVENEFGPINVDRARGSVKARNRHGPIEIRWEASPASACQLETEFGPLEVWLPQDAKTRLDAEAQFGKIEVPATWEVQRETKEPSYAAARSPAGEAGFPLVLRNRHGDITIRIR